MGVAGTGPGQFQHPGDIAVDNETQFVYVSDIVNSRIQKFDENGRYVSEWGASGKGDGEFDHPGDIDIGSSENIVFVTDIGNYRIQKFSKFGDFLLKWGSQGIGDGQFNRPAGIAYDSTDGIVYVLDTMNNRVQKFDTEGNFLSKWGLPGKGNGQFSDPTGYEQGRNSFKTLISWLLEESRVTETHSDFIEIISILRNSVHNNGVYSPTSSKATDKKIVYNGIICDFKINHKINVGVNIW